LLQNIEEPRILGGSILFTTNLLHRYRKPKHRPPPFRLHPDPAAVGFDDAFDQGETNACAFGAWLRLLTVLQTKFSVCPHKKDTLFDIKAQAV
jgi:hypothetical protein